VCRSGGPTALDIVALKIVRDAVLPNYCLLHLYAILFAYNLAMGSALKVQASAAYFPNMNTRPSFTNQLLVAMPSLADTEFSQSVTLVCEHSPDAGALGIVINKPLTMTLDVVFEQMKLQTLDPALGLGLVLCGGPVHRERGFVIHRSGGDWNSSHKISEGIQVTTSRDVLAAMAQGIGPANAFVALGYAGWEAGQLEREMKDNAWLSLPVDQQILFDTPFEDRWHAIWRQLGIDVARISHIAGHA